MLASIVRDVQSHRRDRNQYRTEPPDDSHATQLARPTRRLSAPPDPGTPGGPGVDGHRRRRRPHLRRAGLAYTIRAPSPRASRLPLRGLGIRPAGRRRAGRLDRRRRPRMHLRRPARASACNPPLRRRHASTPRSGPTAWPTSPCRPGSTSYGGPSAVLVVQSSGKIVVFGPIRRTARPPREKRSSRSSTPTARPTRPSATGGVVTFDTSILGIRGGLQPTRRSRPTARSSWAAIVRSRQQRIRRNQAIRRAAHQLRLIDTTFGTGGVAALPRQRTSNPAQQITARPSPSSPTARSWSLQATPLDMIYTTATDADPDLIRLNTDGSVDTSLAQRRHRGLRGSASPIRHDRPRARRASMVFGTELAGSLRFHSAGIEPS